ncbi:MAG: hypothetical protein ABR511_13095 [Acidimicrobiales bacterium]
MDAPLPTLFSSLDANGRFRRDTRLGRLFHPGTVSYREMADADSLHVAVFPDNRISVHVDRVSPLCLRDGARFRYSFVRAVAHNAAVVAEGVRRLVGGGHSPCVMHCEAVAVDDDPPPSAA